MSSAGIGLARLPEQNAAAAIDASARVQPATAGIGLARPAPVNVSPLPPPGELPHVAAAEAAPAPTPAAPAPAPVDLAPAPAPAPAAPASTALKGYDFKTNPLAAIGLVLSETARGLKGQPSGIPEIQRQQLEEQAQQYKQAAFGLDVLDKTSSYISKVPADQRADVIKDLDARFSSVMGGHSIAPFLTLITKGSAAEVAATVGALKELNPSPMMLSYWSQHPEEAKKTLDNFNAEKARKAANPDKTADEIKAEHKAATEGDIAGGGGPESPAQAAAKAAAETSARQGVELKSYKVDGQPQLLSATSAATLQKGGHKIEPAGTAADFLATMMDIANGGGSGGAAAAVPTVKTQADYAKLPKGSAYIGPDGKKAVKQ